MIFGAGGDKGAFIKVTERLKLSIPDKKRVRFHWFTTSLNPNLSELVDAVSKVADIGLYINSSFLPMFINNADLAVTSGGNTTFELAYFKKPMIIIPFVENQRFLAEAWEKVGIAVSLKNFQEHINLKWNKISYLISNSEKKYKDHEVVPGNGEVIIVDFIINNYLK